jgi:predicted amidophosphoribosyltransferase
MNDDSKERVFSLCLRCGYASHRERGERFCIHCGIELATECPKCGNPIVHPWGEHCPFCGRRHTALFHVAPSDDDASLKGGRP